MRTGSARTRTPQRHELTCTSTLLRALVGTHRSEAHHALAHEHMTQSPCELAPYRSTRSRTRAHLHTLLHTITEAQVFVYELICIRSRPRAVLVPNENTAQIWSHLHTHIYTKPLRSHTAQKCMLTHTSSSVHAPAHEHIAQSYCGLAPHRKTRSHTSSSAHAPANKLIYTRPRARTHLHAHIAQSPVNTHRTDAHAPVHEPDWFRTELSQSVEHTGGTGSAHT